MKRLVLCALAAACLAAGASVRACSVPVFRYALDNWRADNYRLELPAGYAKDEKLAAFTRNLGADSPLNLEVATLPAGEVDTRLLFPPKENAASPAIWSGSLDAAALAKLTNSPARREIVRRILASESVVWVLVGSGNHDDDDALAKRVEKRLTFLESVAQIPQIDPNDPTSKLGPGPELRAKFSLLRIGTPEAGVPTESAFLAMLAGPKADAALAGGPWLAAVFGRGRVLGAWPAESFGDEQIEEACLFLLGACSCQVKRQNPGWDLLLCVDWDKELAAAAATAGTSDAAQPAKGNSAAQPETVTISGDELNNAAADNRRAVILVGGALLLLAFGALAWRKFAP
ncbi:MAG: hypothetical protein HY300_08955 [Verrucomicrobia bacterium]|nr:hypothetical protein [Verrucomicrobiota bacterium]